jgi:hypothetical protein
MLKECQKSSNSYNGMKKETRKITQNIEKLGGRGRKYNGNKKNSQALTRGYRKRGEFVLEAMVHTGL